MNNTMDTPELTLVERRILTNQFKIMAALDIDGDRDGYARFAAIVEEGFGIDYDDIFVSLSEPVSVGECRFVRDVLNMYTQLQRGLDAATDKRDVEEREVVFHGFDGNCAPGRLGYLRFLREDGKWTDVRIAKPDMNSHGFGDGQYPSMLERFATLKKNYDLSIDDVRLVLGK